MGSTMHELGREPIAIIGLSCKFAGDASSPEKMWDMVAQGRSGWSEIPASRFNVTGTHHPNHEKISTTHVKGAHFIEEDPGRFDAAFFNFSTETASALDPQFRLQLESVYEALENVSNEDLSNIPAGLPLSRVKNSNTSVYAGTFAHDYHEGLMRDEQQLPRFLLIGTCAAMSANRISHFFDLRGASMTLDTGCSGSLVALHQAVSSLRTRESDMSIVTGANLLLAPDMFKVLGSIGMLSPDGKSYAFDSRANGYGRGEGVATVVIKRLNDALACGDPIRAVIRETGLNQDGKTETITTPSQAAQEELIEECYRRAGLDPGDTQYFEAHGTGTTAGDATEAQAIAAVFGASNRDQALRIGSVKTNIGHTEPVSGLAGLIKVVLALEKDQIPPSINFEKPNPKLALEKRGLQVARSLERWPVTKPHQPRRVSLNNFGFGGSNSHVILEGVESFVSPPKRLVNSHSKHEHDDDDDHETTVLVLSARDEEACRRMVSNLKEYLQTRNSTTEASELMQNLSYTLGDRRTLFSWVSASPVRYQKRNNLNDVIQALHSPTFTPIRTPTRRPRIGMVFTGQGAQWHAMGRELLTSYPIFKTSLQEAERDLKTLGADWSLLEELQQSEETSKINTTALSIPICVALQIALVRLLESWGITPTCVTSHSSGEIAAAYAAGALSLDQAMAAAYYRAALAADPKMRRAGEKGAMLAVGLGAGEAYEHLKNLRSGGRAVVACINSPDSVTIAGDVSAVEEFDEACKRDSVFSRRLRVDTGYHSHHMQPIAKPYLELLRKHMPEDQDDDDDDEPAVAFSSAVTGGRVDSMRQIANPKHWVGSLVQPVQFVQAFTDMVLGGTEQSGGSNVDVLLEVGPHPALGAPIREILSTPEFEGLDIPYYSCLTRKEHAGDTMRTTAVNLLHQGLPLDMHSVNFPSGRPNLRVLSDLPSYPWNHSNRHWQESRISRSIRARDQAPHALLGSPVPGVNTETTATWRNIVRVAEAPWLRDHVVQNNVVYPGAGYICLAIEAAKQLLGIQNGKDIKGYRLRDVELLAALVIPDNADGIEVQTKLTQVNDKIIGARGWRQFEVSSVTGDGRWTIHAKGLVRVDFAVSTRSGNGIATDDHAKLPIHPLSKYVRHVNPEDMFSSLRSQGICHGPKFQNTTNIEQDGKEARSVSHVTVADTAVENDLRTEHVLHPTTLDSFILSAYSALPAGDLEDDAKLPYSIRKMWVSSSISRETGHAFRCHTSLAHANARNFQADAVVVDEKTSKTYDAVLEIQGLVCQSVGRTGSSNNKGSAKSNEQLCSKVEWAPDLSLRQPKALENFRKLHSRPADTVDRDLVIRLRRVCVYFCHDALHGLTAKDVAKLEPHHVKFHHWMQDQIQLAASGKQGPGSEKWTRNSPQEREREIALAAQQSADGEMVCHLGPNLLSILRGELNPLEFMMEERLLYKYYAEAVRMGPSLAQLAALLRKVVHKNPRARILEIGGGTGGATRHMLKALGTAEDGGPRAASWHFTDISSGFFEAAHAQFAEWSEIMQFDRLDIEKDPAAQGFELASYDIVVACEVLHATKSMARTMANVRSLMKPGGTLLMMETTQDCVDLQFIFGLLPGWWLSEEPERQSSPSLSIPFCDRVLRGADFSGIDFAIRDCESDDMYSISVIMSTSEAEHKGSGSKGPVYSDDVVIVISNRESPPDDMTESLSKSIQTCMGGAEPAVVAMEDAQDSSAYSGKLCVFLGEVMQPALLNMDQSYFDAIKNMSISCKGLVWVTIGGAVQSLNPDASLSHGLLRTLRNEFMGRKYISLDLEGPLDSKSISSTAVSTITKVVELGFVRSPPQDASAVDFEYAERDGVLLVPRLYKDGERNQMLVTRPTVDWEQPETMMLDEELFFQENRPLRLEVGIPGLLDTLAFGDDERDEVDENVNPSSPLPSDMFDMSEVKPINPSSSLPPDMVEIEPRAYGLNFLDLMAAMGQVKEGIMGIECSGIITRLGTEAQSKGYQVGDHVMAVLLGPIASRARISWHAVAHMPKDMTFEDAASLPMIYSTAYFGLVDTARFQPGQSILIHSAAGGVGQAALMLAKHLGAGEIFVTVGSQKKRDFVKREYGIPDSHIFSSRNASFASSILAATHGRGVDVVLNSLAGPLLQASFDVVATFGHLVEIGKRDLQGNSLLEMGAFSPVASYSSLDVLALIRHRGPDVHRVLSEISRLIQEKIIGPVRPVTVYSIGDMAKALRMLQAGEHIGKMVLSTKPGDIVKVLPRMAGPLKPVRLCRDASYLLVGGVGGLGRSIAHWLVDHGARNLILMSRSAGDSEKSAAFVAELAEAGCRVKAISCDVAIAGHLAKAIRFCQEEENLPPIRGVIQGAMALQDSVLEHMTLKEWQACISPKVYGTHNLHVQWSQPGDLDFFVMLSSLAGTLGLVSQANYAAGNVYQDALAHWRQARGLPGVSIDLGAVKDVGYVAEALDRGIAQRLRAAGETLMLPERAVHRALGVAIAHGGENPQILLGLNTGPGPQWDEGNSAMTRDARFAALRHHESTTGRAALSGSSGSDAESLAARLGGAETVERAAGMVGDVIAAKLAAIFMLPESDIDLTQAPRQYGIDSLVAVELRNMLVLQAGADVSVFNIIQSASLAALAALVVDRSKFVGSDLGGRVVVAV